PGAKVKDVIDKNKKRVFDVVETAYRLLAAGDAINPDSYFLRYPDKPSARIIALPAHLGGAIQKSGIKWISSFPENRAGNLARALPGNPGAAPRPRVGRPDPERPRDRLSAGLHRGLARQRNAHRRLRRVGGGAHVARSLSWDPRDHRHRGHRPHHRGVAPVPR